MTVIQSRLEQVARELTRQLEPVKSATVKFQVNIFSFCSSVRKTFLDQQWMTWDKDISFLYKTLTSSSKPMFNFILLLYECSLTRNVSASERQHLLSKLQAIYQNFSATPIKETEGLVNIITNMALQRVYYTRGSSYKPCFVFWN